MGRRWANEHIQVLRCAEVYFHFHDATFALRHVIDAPSWLAKRSAEDVWQFGRHFMLLVALIHDICRAFLKPC